MPHKYCVNNCIIIIIFSSSSVSGLKFTLQLDKVLSRPNTLKWEGMFTISFCSPEYLEKCSYEVLTRQYRYVMIETVAIYKFLLVINYNFLAYTMLYL